MMAGTYWLWPQLTNRRLYSRPIGLLQVVVWFGGMALMSNAMHVSGLYGIPRRTAEPQYQGFDFSTAFGSVAELNVQLAIGGTLLFVSALLFLANLAFSWGNPTTSGLGQTLPPALSGPDDSPRVLDNMRLWAAIALVLVALAYALPLGAIVADSGLFGPGGDAYPVTVVLDSVAVAAERLTASVAGGVDVLEVSR
jgi:cytochrome c oxidase subunit 1